MSARISSKKAQESNMIKCSTCHAHKEEKAFINHSGRKLMSCNVCRAKYMESKAKLLGIKRCSNCKADKKYEEFTKQDKTFSNCYDCRLAWYETQKIDDEYSRHSTGLLP
jgi:hypothetical protein